MVKSIVHPTTGQTLFFGRKRPIEPPKLKLKDYLDLSALPGPPATFSYAPAAAAPLAQVYLNDQLGDCVIACMAHMVGVYLGNAGITDIFEPSQIVALYSAIGGYVPGDPSTDNGCDELTALHYWRTKGAPKGHNRPLGWVGVDPTNPAEYRAACWLFENLMFGIELPDEWITPFPSAPGFVWDAAGSPDPDNGHCFDGVGADPEGIEICTWGMLGTVTDAAISEYASAADGGELYAVINQEMLVNGGKAPNGLDWQQLKADFAAL